MQVCGFESTRAYVRVDGLCSALGLKPAFKVQVKVNKKEHALRYRVYGLAWVLLDPFPQHLPTIQGQLQRPRPLRQPPPPHRPPHPYQTIPLGGGGGRERQTPDHICIYMITRSAAPPPPPPPWSMVQDAPLVWDGVWVPSSPCGVVVGVLGFWV